MSQQSLRVDFYRRPLQFIEAALIGGLGLLGVQTATEGNFIVTAINAYILFYLFHGRLLPRPYLELTPDALVIRSAYHRYLLDFADVTRVLRTDTSRPPGLAALVWAIMTGGIFCKPIPAVEIDYQQPHWYVNWFLLPPIPLLFRSRCYKLPLTDEWTPFFEELARRTTGKFERDDLTPEVVAR